MSIYNNLIIKKKKINFFFIFISFILLFSTTVRSQQGVSLGFKYGYGYSRYYFLIDRSVNGDIVTQDFVPVYEAGLVFSHLEKHMGLQIELQYTQKAWSETFNNSSSRKVVLHFIEMPILTHVRFGRKKSGLLLNGGMYVAHSFRFQVDTVGPLDPVSDSIFINYNNLSYNNFDYGLKIGVGYDFGLGFGNLQFQVMYSQSLQNLLKLDRLKIYRSLNQSLFASVIFKIPLNRKVRD